jgi:hypothetical protein
VVLTLSAKSEGSEGSKGSRVRYVFSAPHEASGAETAEGTGLRYIRARLQESFGSDWTLASGPAGSLWRTELTIPRRRTRCAS